MMKLPTVLVVLSLSVSDGQICYETKLVSRPARVSYLQSARRMKQVPCCSNPLCDPPVCTRASFRLSVCYM